MSTEYIMTCRVCGKTYKRYAYQVYMGVEGVCVKCNREIPFDGEETKKEPTPTQSQLSAFKEALYGEDLTKLNKILNK